MLLTLGALGILGLLLARSDWRELIRPLAAARPGWLIAAIALASGVEVAKTARWQWLLGRGFAHLPHLLALVFTGRLLNLLAPLRAGDLWRVASATGQERQPLLVTGGSVVAEKLLDGAALAVAGAVLVWLPGERGLWILLPPVAAIGGMTIALAIGVRIGSQTIPTRWMGHYLIRWRRAGVHSPPPVARQLSDGGTQDPATQIQRAGMNWTRFLGIGGLTVAGLGLGLLVNLAALQALGLPATTAAVLAMLVSGYAAGLLPAGPGQLGVFELAVAAPLIEQGFPPTSAVAAALTLHLVMLTMLLLGGAISLPLNVRLRTGKRPRGGDR